MVDEELEIKALLDGQRFNHKGIYRVCFLLSKWFKEQGYSQLETRTEILKWAKAYDVQLQNVNAPLTHAYKDSKLLVRKPQVFISQRDVEEINYRFDNKKVKLIALALLCYAKINANINNELNISIMALSDWVGVYQSHLVSRYLPELYTFDYVKRIRIDNFAWNNTEKRTKMTKLVFNVPLMNNTSEWQLVDNDIVRLYKQIFK